jgi:acetylornithine deacetylase/succinyl-diaminopimelate desuccinylase-like protein
MTALAPGSPTVLIYNHFDVQPEAGAYTRPLFSSM